MDFQLSLPSVPNEFSGTRTESNLWEAYIEESMAAGRYTYYASVAKKAGYEQIADILRITAANEREHAKIWFKLLNQIGDLPFNLAVAANNEHREWNNSYPNKAREAYEDGFSEIGHLFDDVAKIEKHHEEVFRGLLHGVESQTFFQDTGLIFWECRNCGYIELTDTAPILCPVCSHPQAYFQKLP